MDCIAVWTKRLVPALMALVVLAPAWGQEAAGRTYPSLPDAVTTAPADVARDAIFDVGKFLQAPPAEQNAAPLVLDALFEFATEVEFCFPEGPERDRRKQQAEARNKALYEVFTRWNKDPKSVPAAELDPVIAAYQVGFDKLAAAQKRPRCLFETGLGVSALMPHAQAVRGVSRVSAMRVQRALDRGDFEAALNEVALNLRLVRDIQPRGYMIAQLVAVASTSVITSQMIVPILNAPGLKSEHCDRLLTILRDHESQSIDGYAEGLRAEYLSGREMALELTRSQAELKQKLQIPAAESILALCTDIKTVAPPVQPPFGAAPQPAAFTPKSLKRLEDELLQTTPGQLSAFVKSLNAYYQAEIDLKATPYAKRLASLPDPAKAFAGDAPMMVTGRLLAPAMSAFTAALGRNEATLHATEALVAIKRWELNHKALPTTLAEATAAANLTAVPTDPFDGQPLRMVVIDGNPIVYSVGKDGKDDHGQDSLRDTRPGDLLFGFHTARPSAGLLH
ncbi:MAG TPA: hypothetical protein VGZ22_13815 [Isosphaeraceae bacterium]|jgi:hypothetical protein|nr:hypothetical protein [Isosphaeraceae bacterium]